MPSPVRGACTGVGLGLLVTAQLLVGCHSGKSQGQGGHITVGARRDGPWVEICVADDGPGMDPKDLDRVVDPFFSGKGSPDASGLGMFISFSIIQNHGGLLSVASVPEQGTEFTLRLPVAGPSA